MNLENRGYYLRNRSLGQPQAEHRDTVQGGDNLQAAEEQQQQPQPTTEYFDMYQPTGLQLEKFAGDDQDGKSWLEWFERYCTFHKQDEGQQLLTMPFYLTSHARIWYDALDDKIKTSLKDLKEAFKLRFKTHDILDTELLEIVQRPEETSNDYFSRVLKKAQYSNADKKLVTSLAVKGLRPAIKAIVMPLNPQTFDDARQRAILAEKTVISTTPPVAAYVNPRNDARVEELTNMVRDLQAKLDAKSSTETTQPPQQQKHHGGRKKHWRKPQHQSHYQPWNQQGGQPWNQQGGHWQQSHNQNWQQGPAQQQHPCPGCRGEDLNCNFPGKCRSFYIICNNCNQKGHYAKACPNQGPR